MRVRQDSSLAACGSYYMHGMSMDIQICVWHGSLDMPDSGGRLKTALDGYAKFLKDKDLALPKQQPYLVRWVREFLLFAREHGG